MEDLTINIYSMPQEFPCGPDSSCCGPIGQTEEELRMLKQQLEKELDVSVKTFNVKNGADMKTHRHILSLLRSFGWNALPVIAVNGDVVSMGLPSVAEAVEMVRRKLKSVAG